MIYLYKVTKEYWYETGFSRSVDNISLAIENGEFVSILGPAGSGKSALLRLMGGLDRPGEGSVLVEGKRLQELNETELASFRKRKIGFVPQSSDLIPKLTALENVLMPFSHMRVIGDKISYGVALLRKVGLAGKEKINPSGLSEEELRRVAIARALVMNPEIILADDPTGNLDVGAGENIFELLQKLNGEGKTVVIATRDEELAAKTKRVICIWDGRIEEEFL